MYSYPISTTKNVRKKATLPPKTNILSQPIKFEEMKFQIPICSNIIQRERSNNPVPQNKNDACHGFGTTAHHIISRDTLMTAYNKLNREQQLEVAIAARPNDWNKEDDGNSEIVATDLQCIEWPQGNLFYGPHESIRAEKSNKKEDLDDDARYIVPKSHFQKLKAFNQEIKGANNDRDKIKSVLIRFYQYAKNIPATPFDENKWQELTDRESIDYWLMDRKHSSNNVYIPIDEIPVDTPLEEQDTEFVKKHPKYPAIYMHNSVYKYNGKEISKVNKAGKIYIKNTDKSGVINYLNNVVPEPLTYSTYVPKALSSHLMRKAFQYDLFVKIGWTDLKENGEQLISLIRNGYKNTGYGLEFISYYNYYKRLSQEAYDCMKNVEETLRNTVQLEGMFIDIDTVQMIKENYETTLKNYTLLLERFTEDAKILKNRKDKCMTKEVSKHFMEIRLHNISDRISKLRLHNLRKTLGLFKEFTKVYIKNA